MCNERGSCNFSVILSFFEFAHFGVWILFISLSQKCIRMVFWGSILVVKIYFSHFVLMSQEVLVCREQIDF